MPERLAEGGVVVGESGPPSLVVRVRETTGPSIVLAAVGDVGFAGRPSVAASGELFREVVPMLRGADVAFANFEGVLVENGGCDALFTSLGRWAEVIAEAGFGVVHLANNHALDLGPEGLRSTVGALESAGLTALGVGPDRNRAAEPSIQEIGGIRLGWLAAGKTGQHQKDPGWTVNELNAQSLLETTERTARSVDCLIVSLHCGYMWLDYPSPEIRRLARELAAAGAKLILMHHPHVLQGVEVTDGGAVICYSLGNFLFDWEVGNIRSEVAVDLEREGAIFRFGIDRDGVASLRVIPTRMDDTCRVCRPVRGQALRSIERLDHISRDIETGAWHRGFFRQRSERNTGHGIKALWFLVRTGKLRDFARETMKIRPRHFSMLVRWIVGKVRRVGS